jgi:hypothetical protein
MAVSTGVAATYSKASAKLPPRMTCSVRKRGDILDRPQPIGDAGRRRGRDPKRLVDSDKVVMHEVRRNGCLVMGNLL